MLVESATLCIVLNIERNSVANTFTFWKTGAPRLRFCSLHSTKVHWDLSHRLVSSCICCFYIFIWGIKNSFSFFTVLYSLELCFVISWRTTTKSQSFCLDFFMEAQRHFYAPTYFLFSCCVLAHISLYLNNIEKERTMWKSSK